MSHRGFRSGGSSHSDEGSYDRNAYFRDHHRQTSQQMSEFIYRHPPSGSRSANPHRETVYGEHSLGSEAWRSDSTLISPSRYSRQPQGNQSSERSVGWGYGSSITLGDSGFRSGGEAASHYTSKSFEDFDQHEEQEDDSDEEYDPQSCSFDDEDPESLLTSWDSSRTIRNESLRAEQHRTRVANDNEDWERQSHSELERQRLVREEQARIAQEYARRRAQERDEELARLAETEEQTLREMEWRRAQVQANRSTPRAQRSTFMTVDLDRDGSKGFRRLSAMKSVLTRSRDRRAAADRY